MNGNEDTSISIKKKTKHRLIKMKSLCEYWGNQDDIIEFLIDFYEKHEGKDEKKTN